MQSKMARWWLAATLLALTAVPALAAGRGYLGVTTQSTDEDLRRGLDLTRDGLLVNQVSDGSPADRGGLRKGDVILTYNGHSVTDPEDLRRVVRDTDPGSRATLGIWRDGERRTLQVRVGQLPGSDGNSDEMDETPVPPDAPQAPEAPEAPRAPRSFHDDDHGDVHRRVIINGREVPDDEIDDSLKDLPGIEGLKDLKHLKGFKDMHSWTLDGSPGNSMFFTPGANRGRLGVRIEKLNGDLGDALGVGDDKGVLITEVLEDTPAQKAGLKAGDVIVRVGDDDVSSPEDLVQALSSREGQVNLTVLRRGSRRDIEAELGARGDTRSFNFAPRAFDLRNRLKNSEPGPGSRGFRGRTSNQDESELREEIRQLQQELRDLREQMNEKDKR